MRTVCNFRRQGTTSRYLSQSLRRHILLSSREKTNRGGDLCYRLFSLLILHGFPLAGGEIWSGIFSSVTPVFTEVVGMT